METSDTKAMPIPAIILRGQREILFNAGLNKENLFDHKRTIHKLSLYLQGKQRIDIKDIEETVGKVRIFSIFELTKSLGEKRAGQSLRIFRQLLEAGQSPVGIVSLIANHFRKLHLIKVLIAQGKSQAEMAPILGISPTFLKEFIQKARLFTLDEIASIATYFPETDLQLKSSSLSQDLVLFLLFWVTF